MTNPESFRIRCRYPPDLDSLIFSRPGVHGKFRETPDSDIRFSCTFLSVKIYEPKVGVAKYPWGIYSTVTSTWIDEQNTCEESGSFFRHPGYCPLGLCGLR